MLVTTGLLLPEAAADSAFIAAPLQRTGADRNASGLVTINLGDTNSSMLLQVTNLTPGRRYTVNSGGLVRGSFIANRTGRGQVRFTQPKRSGTLPLNFDPRGRQVVVVLNDQAVLRARISAAGEPPRTIVDEQVRLPRVGAAAGTANTHYELLTNGTRRFSVTLTNVQDGDWTVFVDGIQRGMISVSGGSGTLTRDTDPATADSALNFDPRRLVVDVAQGNILRFSGRFEARAAGINSARPLMITQLLPSAGTVAGSAQVRRWVDRDARRGADVELLNVPVGDYELYTNGRFQGFIPVLDSVNGTAGEMRFVSEPDDEDERPLNFNALTNSYIIQRDGILLFAGQPMPGEVTDTNGVPVRFTLPLFNLGRDRDAIARVQYKRDERGSRHFEAMLRNVAAGDYTLNVNGVAVGTIQVVNVANGTRGVIEFEDEPELGENVLTFDPLGSRMAINAGGVRYFDRTLPARP